MPLSRRSALGALGALAAFALVPFKGRAAPPKRIGVIGAGWLGGTVGRRGGPGFRANTTAPELRRLLGLPEGS